MLGPHCRVTHGRGFLSGVLERLAGLDGDPVETLVRFRGFEPGAQTGRVTAVGGLLADAELLCDATPGPALPQRNLDVLLLERVEMVPQRRDGREALIGF